MAMEGSEQELNSEAADGEAAEAPVQPVGEADQEEFEGEAPEATGEAEEKIQEEQGTQGEEGEEVAVAEEEGEEQQQHNNQEEDEGFEIGGEEEGYLVQDEIGEEGLHIEPEDEGLEVAEEEEEEKNDEWLLHPGNYFSSDWSLQSQTFFNHLNPPLQVLDYMFILFRCWGKVYRAHFSCTCAFVYLYFDSFCP